MFMSVCFYLYHVMLDCLCLFACLYDQFVCDSVWRYSELCHHDSLADMQQCLYAQDYSQSAQSEGKHTQTHTYMTHFRQHAVALSLDNINDFRTTYIVDKLCVQAANIGGLNFTLKHLYRICFFCQGIMETNYISVFSGCWLFLILDPT